MKHTLRLSNSDKRIFIEALKAEGSFEALALTARIQTAHDTVTWLMMFESEELRLIYSGMAILEFNGVDALRSQEAEALNAQNRDRRKTAQRIGVYDFHPWGADPRGTFKNHQARLRQELAAA